MDRRQYLAIVGGGGAGVLSSVLLASTLGTAESDTDRDETQAETDRDTVPITIEFRDEE